MKKKIKKLFVEKKDEFEIKKKNVLLIGSCGNHSNFINTILQKKFSFTDEGQKYENYFLNDITSNLKLKIIDGEIIDLNKNNSEILNLLSKIVLNSVSGKIDRFLYIRSVFNAKFDDFVRNDLKFFSKVLGKNFFNHLTFVFTNCDENKKVSWIETINLIKKHWRWNLIKKLHLIQSPELIFVGNVDLDNNHSYNEYKKLKKILIFSPRFFPSQKLKNLPIIHLKEGFSGVVNFISNNFGNEINEFYESISKKNFKKIFGISLREILSRKNENNAIPNIIKDIFDYLEKNHDDQNIFKLSLEDNILKNIIKSINDGEKVDFKNLSTISDNYFQYSQIQIFVSSLLKKFLSDLQSPIINYEKLIQIHFFSVNNDSKRKDTLNNFICSISKEKKNFLFHFFKLFKKLINEKNSKIKIQTVTNYFASKIIRKKNNFEFSLKELNEINFLFEYLMNNNDVFFHDLTPDVDFEKEEEIEDFEELIKEEKIIEIEIEKENEEMKRERELGLVFKKNDDFSNFSIFRKSSAEDLLRFQNEKSDFRLMDFYLTDSKEINYEDELESKIIWKKIIKTDVKDEQEKNEKRELLKDKISEEVKNFLKKQENFIFDKKIECSTVKGLIQILTAHNYHDFKFVVDFLFSFRSFTDAKTFLRILQERFFSPPPKNIKIDEYLDFKKKILDVVRIKIIKILKFWIYNFFEFDFDDEIIFEIECFLTKMKKIGYYEQFLIPLEILLNNKINKKVNLIQKLKDSPPEKFILNEIKDIFQWSPMEVAKQICILEFKLFKKITPNEFINENWIIEKRKKFSPNFDKYIEFYSSLSNLTSFYILREENYQKRIKNLAFFIKLSHCLYRLNNFNGVFQIIEGLNHLSVNRLRKTRKHISDKKLKIFETFCFLYSSKSDYNHLREIQKNTKFPSLPFFGLILSDLFFIEQIPKEINNGLINFKKCRKFAKLIRNFISFQKKEYEFKENIEIIEIFKNYKLSSNEKLNQLSNIAEPINGKTLKELEREKKMFDEVDKEIEKLKKKNIQFDEKINELTINLTDSLIFLIKNKEEIKKIDVDLEKSNEEEKKAKIEIELLEEEKKKIEEENKKNI